MSGRTMTMPELTVTGGTALILTVLFDWLLIGQHIGLSLFLFAAALAAALLFVHRGAPARSRLFPAGLCVAAALLPLAENISLLSFCVALVLFILAALTAGDRLPATVYGRAAAPVLFLLTAGLRAPADLSRSWRLLSSLGRRVAPASSLLVWTLPAVAGFVFLALFAEANPVIANWIARIDLWLLLDWLDPVRALLWIAAFGFVWALLRPRLPHLVGSRAVAAPTMAREGASAPDPVTRLATILFGPAAILRSLLVFNGLFALQTGLDAAYLWGGVQLPDGMSYASYAHRGAYPLIVTALLAALFVLVALRTGSAAARNSMIRRLVYLWIAQNVALVASSMLRLELYISVYALTYWRVAAFIWMGIVAAGLVLIVARIALSKSGQWLTGANHAVTGAVLYACCFINFAGLVAGFNVDHATAGRTAAGVDLSYVFSLGAAAVPAVDRYLADPTAPDRLQARAFRNRQAAAHRHAMADWRYWTLRRWRLSRRLDAAAELADAVPIRPVRPADNGATAP